MKATKATIRQRVEDILQIRLDGATAVDVRQYVSGKEDAGEAPWTVPEGGKPISERTLWRYIQQADRLMVESTKEGRKRALRRHVAQRKSLFARAVNVGDLAVALRVLTDEATLLDLYPSKKLEVGGKGGGALVLNIHEEIVSPGAPKTAAAAAMASIVEEVITSDSASADPGTDDRETAPCPEGLPE